MPKGLVVVSVGHIRAGINPSHGCSVALGFNCLALKGDIANSFRIKAWCRDPAETLAKGVDGINHIPVASRVRNAHQALFPIHIPLGNLNEVEYGQKGTKQAQKHLISAEVSGNQHPLTTTVGDLKAVIKKPLGIS